ncbi:MAG: hypothetical protein GXY67_03830 [Clostridiales bacterium]|nr:hypothetical protein [Clostridiales bacterium]
MNRRTSALCCLLLTAALLIALPSLPGSLPRQDGQRMAEHLRPAKTQPLILWILSDPTVSGSYLSRQIALFEKEKPGVRVFLRKADAIELTAPEAVLPDVLLFGPGAFGQPSRILLPLSADMGLSPAMLLAGQSAMIQYALPLWLAPSVLAVPSALLPSQAVPSLEPTQSSLFHLGTPPPGGGGGSGVETPPFLPDASAISWEDLIKPGVLVPPKGMALQQLLSMCPASLRTAFVNNLANQGRINSTPSPTPPQSRTRLLGGKPQATPLPNVQVLSLSACQKAIAAGEALVPFPMTPAAGDNLLLLGLCRDSEPARAFLKHLFSQEAREALTPYGLLPTLPQGHSTDPLYAGLATLYANNPVFPNAFEHTLEELQALCLDGFTRQVDPAETLLRLR